MIRRQFFFPSKITTRYSSSSSSSLFFLSNNLNLNQITTTTRFFSTSSLNPPKGVSPEDLLSSIKESHQSTSGLRFAEQEAAERHRRQQNDDETSSAETRARRDGAGTKYRDGLVTPTLTLQQQQQAAAAASAAPFSPQSATTRRTSQQAEQQQQDPTTATAASSAKFPIANAEPASPLHFRAPSNVLTIGRDPLILQMWQSILSGRRALFLNGADGIGTSTVAAQFAEHARRSGRFSCIHWFGCTKRGNLTSSVKQPEIEQLMKFLAKMRSRKEAEVLLVFDHCEQPQEILKAVYSAFVSSKHSSERNDSVGSFSESDFRSSASRLHLLFTASNSQNKTPSKNDNDNGNNDNPIEILHRIPISSFSSSQQKKKQQKETETEESSKNKNDDSGRTLASEFCPIVFPVDPVDEVPSMLLVERLIMNSLAEEGLPVAEFFGRFSSTSAEKNDDTTNNNNKNNVSANNNNNNNSDIILSDIVQQVASVPLLLVLSSYYVAAELALSPSNNKTSSSSSSSSETILQHIVQEKLPKVLEPAFQIVNTNNNNNIEQDDSTEQKLLSVSTAAACLCSKSIEVLCKLENLSTSGENNNNNVDIDILHQVMEMLLCCNISGVSHQLIEGIVEQILLQKNDNNQNQPTTSSGEKQEAEGEQNEYQHLIDSRTRRIELTGKISNVLRRSGFLMDAGSESTDATFVEEEDGAVIHSALAEGLARKFSTSSSNTKNNNNNNQENKKMIMFNQLLCRIFFKQWPRRMRGGALVNALRISRHLDSLWYRTITGTSSSSSISQQEKDTTTTTMMMKMMCQDEKTADLFNRVASFLAYVEGTHIDLAIKLWSAAFEFYSSSNNNNNNEELAVDIGIQLARVMIGTSRKRKTSSSGRQQQQDEKENEEEEQAEAEQIDHILEQSMKISEKISGHKNIPQDCITGRNIRWAELVSLRARFLPPSEESTLQLLSGAAQIIENELSCVEDDALLNRTFEEKQTLSQEHFVLLVAWAACAENCGKEIPENHWAKMKKLSGGLKKK